MADGSRKEVSDLVIPMKLAGDQLPADEAVRRARIETGAFLAQLSSSHRAAAISELARALLEGTASIINESASSPDIETAVRALGQVANWAVAYDQNARRPSSGAKITWGFVNK